MDPVTALTDLPPHSCAAGVWLVQQLRDDLLDAAIECGLMEFVPCPACTAEVAAAVPEMQERLRQAWAARDRHLARNARLARQADARADRRRVAPDGGTAALPSADAEKRSMPCSISQAWYSTAARRNMSVWFWMFPITGSSAKKR